MLGLGGLWEKWVHSGAVQASVGWTGGHVLGQGRPVTCPPRVASPTGMTEHTKNLLRAFYELSQTHRGKAPRNVLHGAGKPLPLWAQCPHK